MEQLGFLQSSFCLLQYAPSRASSVSFVFRLSKRNFSFGFTISQWWMCLEGTLSPHFLCKSRTLNIYVPAKQMQFQLPKCASCHLLSSLVSGLPSFGLPEKVSKGPSVQLTTERHHPVPLWSLLKPSRLVAITASCASVCHWSSLVKSGWQRQQQLSPGFHVTMAGQAEPFYVPGVGSTTELWLPGMWFLDTFPFDYTFPLRSTMVLPQAFLSFLQPRKVVLAKHELTA